MVYYIYIYIYVYIEGYLDDTTCNCTLYMWFNFIMFWGDIGLHTCLEADDSVVR